MASNNGVIHSAYDTELIAFWRTVYDPTNDDWQEYDWWNPAVNNDPA